LEESGKTRKKGKETVVSRRIIEGLEKKRNVPGTISGKGGRKVFRKPSPIGDQKTAHSRGILLNTRTSEIGRKKIGHNMDHEKQEQAKGRT